MNARDINEIFRRIFEATKCQTLILPHLFWDGEKYDFEKLLENTDVCVKAIQKLRENK